MTAYAMAHLRSVDFNHEIADYILRIDETLQPFGGEFRVHGKEPEVLDGEFEGVIVVIEFPDVQAAKDWYASEAYQDILALRTDNSTGGAFVVEGVEPGYRAASLIEAMA
jgi:uncharacterized protein (DUF1330 family)